MPTWLIQLIVGVVLSVASTILQSAMQADRKQTKVKPVGIRGTVQYGGDKPLSFIMGTCGTAGHQEYPSSTWGSSGETPNAYLVDVISVSDLPITAITKTWVTSEAVTFSGTAGTQGTPATGTFAGYLWQQLLDGTQTSVNSYLDGKFSSHPERPWDTDMIGRGIAYVVMTALYKRELFNVLPSYMFEVQGIPLYDPRKDGSASGTGAHRVNDPSTWEFSDNPVVMIYNIMLGIYYGSTWVWGMQDQNGSKIDPSRLPYSNWSAAMDACDMDISLAGGGTEKQFRAGIEVEVDDVPIDVINKLLKACNGRMSETAGVYSILVGLPSSSVYSFTDDDLLVTEGSQLDPFPGLENTTNGVTATYVEPDEVWETKEAPPRYSSTLEAADDGRRLAQSVTLDTVFSGTQAQRITKAMAEEARRFLKHVVSMPPKGQVLEPLDMVTWTSARNQYASKKFLVISTEEAPNGNVLVGLQEIDPADYDWTPATDEYDSSVAALAPSRPAAQPMSGWSVTGASIKDDGGVGRRPTLQVSFDGPQVDVRAVHVQVRLKSSGDVIFDGEAPFQSPYAVTLNGTFLPDTEYETRGRYLPFSGRETSWSAWLTATTPDIRLGSDDFTEAVNTIRNQTMKLISDVEEQLRVLGSSVANQDASSRAQLVAKFGRAAALVVHEAEARADQYGSLASSLSAVTAQYNEVSASGLFSMVAEAAPTGWDAKITLATRASTGDDFVTTAISLLSDSAGNSQIVLDADNTVFTGKAVSVDGGTYLDFTTGALRASTAV